MRAGSLNNKIIFQEQSSGKDAAGEITNTWTNILTTWASIQTISGKEQFLSNQNFTTLSHKLRVRYSKLINSKQQILFGTRIFKILAVLNIYEKNKELEILVEEVA